MNQKTPKFNEAIAKVFQPPLPYENQCKKCGMQFLITNEEIQLLQLLEVPPPTLCPSCRLRRRRAFANYTTLYKRPCSALGHAESIISQIPDGTQFPVYDAGYYWSDAWDPMSFGKKYREEAQFLEQFQALFFRVPQPQTTRDPMSVNSEYTSYGVQNKNCYYVFGGLNSENIMYSHWPAQSKDCVDCLVPWQSERCYELVYSINCYHCFYIWFCRNCIDCSFCYDCHNCESCFGSVNLRNKKHYFFNEPLTKEAYETKMKEVRPSSYENLTIWKEKFLSFLNSTPKRSVFNERIVNSSGNFLDNCRDCQFGFFQRDSEYCRYADLCLKAKDCMDICLGTSPSHCYEIVLPYDAADSKFSVNLRNQCMNLEYCLNMKNCAYCFGCVGLTNKKFCLLNTQYAEDEYRSLVDKIKTGMLETGEYGEFFEMNLSPFPYNASLAAISHPKTEDEVKKEGLSWIESSPLKIDITVLKASELPNEIQEVQFDITKKAIECEKTKRLFRIVPQELEFYKKENLSLPHLHPHERLLNRLTWMGFPGLSETNCMSCNSTTLGNLKTGLTMNFLCERCYQKTFI